MIIILKSNASKDDLKKIKEAVKEFGYKAEVVEGESKTIVGAVGNQKEKQQHMNLLGQLRNLQKMINISFIGMAACGKSTIGKAVANKIGVSFVDTDLLIEQKHAATLEEIKNFCSTTYNVSFPIFQKVHAKDMTAIIIVLLILIA